MSEWLNHPAVQCGLAPFIAALIAAKLLNRVRLSGLAVIAGFVSTVYLAADFNFEPLSAVRKIILSGLIAAAIAPLLDLAPRNWRLPRQLIVVACGGVVLWVLWPALRQKEAEQAALYAAGCAAYVIWLAWLTDRLAACPIRAGAAGMGLGLASGTAALFGASALLGQFGLAVGAACGAYLLIQALSGKPLSCGRTFTLPLSLLCGLVAPAALLLARLPWYCLPLLALIPAIAHLPLPGAWSLRKQGSALSSLVLTGAAVPIFLAWHAAAMPPG